MHKRQDLPVEEAGNVTIVQVAILGHLVPGAATCPGFNHTCNTLACMTSLLVLCNLMLMATEVMDPRCC